MTTDAFTFVVSVNNREILERNLLASPCLRARHRHQILLQEGFDSAAKAYNDALRRADNDLVVFIHQDMYLPNAWLQQVRESLQRLEESDPNWGIAGCWGASRDGRHWGHVYSTGLGVLGREFTAPTPVQTLDEIVLILRRSTGVTFDEGLPHFHFYGTDISLRVTQQGRCCYVIPAFSIHNTRQIIQLPREFYECYEYVRRVWWDQLPIQTSCIRVSRSNAEVYRRKVEDAFKTLFSRGRIPTERVADPADILARVSVA